MIALANVVGILLLLHSGFSAFERELYASMFILITIFRPEISQDDSGNRIAPPLRCSPYPSHTRIRSDYVDYCWMFCRCFDMSAQFHYSRISSTDWTQTRAIQTVRLTSDCVYFYSSFSRKLEYVHSMPSFRPMSARARQSYSEK